MRERAHFVSGIIYFRDRPAFDEDMEDPQLWRSIFELVSIWYSL